MSTALLLALLSGPRAADELGIADVCGPRPALVVTPPSLDFGSVEPGETVTRTAFVRNDGAAPLGVGSIQTDPDADAFEVTVEVDAVDCVTVATADRGDTGFWPPGDSGPDLLTDYVLEPGCRLPVTVSFTANERGTVRDALVVSSNVRPAVQAASGLDYEQDWLHGLAVTWLRAEAPPARDRRRAPRIIGNTVVVGQTALVQGDRTPVSVRVDDGAGCGPLTTLWSTEGRGTFVDPSALSTEFVAPAPEHEWARLDGRTEPPEGRFENLYALMINECGQDWAFGRVAVFEWGVPLHGDCPPPDLVAEETGCGCGTSGGGVPQWLVGFVVAGVLAYTRRKLAFFPSPRALAGRGRRRSDAKRRCVGG